MKPVIVIPARYGSTRFPGKPLACIRGAGGIEKPLIQRTWERARLAAPDHRIIVATDDVRIKDACEVFGAECMMTNPDHRNGTERCAEVSKRLGGARVVNLQGDAPLVPVECIRYVLPMTATAWGGPVVTAASIVPADEGFGQGLVFIRDMGDAGVDFVRARVPLSRAFGQLFAVHLGIYGYSAEALQAYAAADPSEGEAARSLEQLRWRSLDYEVLVLSSFEPVGYIAEVNEPGDIINVESILSVFNIP